MLRIVPPLSVSALAPIPIPLASRSDACTAYSKWSVRPTVRRYVAWRVCVPIVSPSCGLPVTVTGILKATLAPIFSPAPYVSPLTGVLVIAAPVTAGAVALLPVTLWVAAAAVAWLPKLRLALVPTVLRIVPPFSVSALAAIPIPSASESVDCTV